MMLSQKNFPKNQRLAFTSDKRLNSKISNVTVFPLTLKPDFHDYSPIKPTFLGSHLIRVEFELNHIFYNYRKKDQKEIYVQLLLDPFAVHSFPLLSFNIFMLNLFIWIFISNSALHSRRVISRNIFNEHRSLFE